MDKAYMAIGPLHSGQSERESEAGKGKRGHAKIHLCQLALHVYGLHGIIRDKAQWQEEFSLDALPLL